MRYDWFGLFWVSIILFGIPLFLGFGAINYYQGGYRLLATLGIMFSILLGYLLLNEKISNFRVKETNKK